MFLRVSIYLNALVFLALIPYLEVSQTHVFNPDWPGHARLHEVWQLITNGLLSIIAVVLAGRPRRSVLAGAVALSINAGFLGALASSGSYGGSMMHSDGTELLVAGVNPASAIIGALSLAIFAGMLLARKVNCDRGMVEPN
ncbi:MAG: hypothetical protein EP341_02445 [Sphingomonadales bacterium]|nr:MAG: hypothetical protein EP341_02445 [Sphingomonadales bacterium]